MTFEELKERARELIEQQGCSANEAINLAAQGTELANQADELLNIQHEIELEIQTEDEEDEEEEDDDDNEW